MSTSSESAEQLIRICLEGTDYALRISGSAVKNIAVALYTISKDKSKSKGKTRLSNMLKTEKDLKIFSIKKDEMKIFAKEAKSYGVLYCALVNKSNKNTDDMIDIMVRAEDAPKINRIVERFNLTTVNTANIENKLKKELEVKKEEQAVNVADTPVIEEKVDDDMVEDIFSKPEKKTENESPLLLKTETDSQLENFSMNRENLETTSEKGEKKSVKKELAEIKKEQQIEKETQKSKSIDVPKTKNSQQNIKVNKKERGK